MVYLLTVKIEYNDFFSINLIGYIANGQAKQ